MQIINGLQMFLANQNFDDRLVSIKQHDYSFSRKEKQNLNKSKHMNGISITRGSNILSIRSDNGAQITTLVNTNLKVIHY